MAFNFERLPHQAHAVKRIMEALRNVPYQSATLHANPLFDFTDPAFPRGIDEIQRAEGLPSTSLAEGRIDVQMETGTGKTYTYTKLLLELHREFGVGKFIILVPTLAIKSGTRSFLQSPAARQHFREQYQGVTIHLHELTSQKNRKKTSKSDVPTPLRNFLQSDQNAQRVDVLLINSGMLLSRLMTKEVDSNLFTELQKPIEALRAVNPFLIIDEAHRFKEEDKTWREHIALLDAQMIIRFGATFPLRKQKGRGKGKQAPIPDYKNLVYRLSSLDAFRGNLVKGVSAHIISATHGQDTAVEFKDVKDRQAHFSLREKGKTLKRIPLSPGDSLSRIHPAMEGLHIEKLKTKVVLLSNGLELHKGDKLNPFSYSATMQAQMVGEAVLKHFELEMELWTRRPRIKPLSLFFIDSIEGYRNQQGELRRMLETEIEAVVTSLLPDVKDPDLRKSWQAILSNIPSTHGGYFSQDNSSNEEQIAQEVDKILNGKEQLLNLSDPCRFIVSKWTLREGWDNPNIFQICKLRSSGSETTKLQEVGRGLRLPVNEHGNRETGDAFHLHYYVDFTEQDFVDRLIAEVNGSEGISVAQTPPPSMTQELLERIVKTYGVDKNTLCRELIDKGWMDLSHDFIGDGYQQVVQAYPLVFNGVSSDKIHSATSPSPKVHIKVEKYPKLKEIWEKINERVLLQYNFAGSKHEFRDFFVEFLRGEERKLQENHLRMETHTLELDEQNAHLTSLSEPATPYSTPCQQKPLFTMRYGEFLEALSQELYLPLPFAHEGIRASGIDINRYLHRSTIRRLKTDFQRYLLAHSFSKFSIGYQKVSSTLHPTKLTDAQGAPLREIPASEVGTRCDGKASPASSYYLREIFYDSELERENMTNSIAGVVVFTKIPKGAIRIPIAGGASYSPDFAYVLERKDGGKTLHMVVESKHIDSDDQLRLDERKKIQHAQQLYSQSGTSVRILFRKQLDEDKMVKLIGEAWGA